MKRLTIYAFYDPHGIVDDYVVDCVTAISEHSARVIVVSNGRVEETSLRRLTAISAVEVSERPNEGFDIWGYKHGLDLVGWDELERYDEVVLMNSTIAGPLYPLSEMFDAMDARDVDFWGMTVHAGEDFDPWEMLPAGRLERHLQSYFTAVRRRMFMSAEFHDYWDSLNPIRSYTAAVALHEAIFTGRFAELGFHWTSYVDSSDLEHVNSYPLMFLPEQMLIGKRCPFFKRKALFLTADDLAATRATSTLTMVECLRELRYDLDRILPNVIRTCHQSDLRLAQNAFTVLDTTVADADITNVRVVARVKDLPSCLALERCGEVLVHCAEAVIVTEGDDETELVERLGHVGARIVRGAGFAGFLGEVGRAAGSGDHVLLLGFTGDFSGRPPLTAYAHYEMGALALAESTARLAAAAAQIDASDVFGALAAPLSNLSLLTPKRVIAELPALLHDLGVSVPLSADKPAWGPPCGAVLAGPGMLGADWERIADAADEMGNDGAEDLFTALIPFLLQGKGKLLGFALPREMAATAALGEHLRSGQEAAAAADRAERSRRLRPAHVYHNTGDGYDEDSLMLVYPRRIHDDQVQFAWKAPAGVLSVRFDPVERCGVICRGVTATVDGAQAEIVPVNCLRFSADLDIFMTTDPIYDLRGVTPEANIAVTMAGIDYIDVADFIPSYSADGILTYGEPLKSALIEVLEFMTWVRSTYWWRARSKLASARNRLLQR